MLWKLLHGGLGSKRLSLATWVPGMENSDNLFPDINVVQGAPARDAGSKCGTVKIGGRALMELQVLEFGR